MPKKNIKRGSRKTANTEDALKRVGEAVKTHGNPFGIIGAARRKPESESLKPSISRPAVVLPKTNTGGLAGRKRRESSVSVSSSKRHATRVRSRQKRRYN